MPKWMLFNIANQLIIPKLLYAIENWNFKTGYQIHSWLFPWYPIFGDLLYPLWTACRRKFQVYLTNWVVGDPSAMSILKAWSEVLFIDPVIFRGGY
jgi:tuftelin-interacting protein 11